MSEWTLRVEGHEEQCPKREMKGWKYSITNYKPRYLGYCTCSMNILGNGRYGGDLALCTMADIYIKLTAGRHKHSSELEWGCDWCDFCHTGEEVVA